MNVITGVYIVVLFDSSWPCKVMLSRITSYLRYELRFHCW